MKTIKISSTQGAALAGCVRKAYDEGWSGNMRETSKRPMLRLTSYRGGVTQTTKDSMENKGLIAWTSQPRQGLKNYYILTPEGVAAGEEYYEKKHRVSAERHSEEDREAARAEKQDYADRVAAVKTKFKGLNLKSRTRGKKKSVGAHIESSFKEPAGYNRLDLSLEDLEVLGAGIDKLR